MLKAKAKKQVPTNDVNKEITLSFIVGKIDVDSFSLWTSIPKTRVLIFIESFVQLLRLEHLLLGHLWLSWDQARRGAHSRLSLRWEDHHSDAIQISQKLARLQDRWESCLHPDLEFVKKITRPNFRAKKFYTLKMRKWRLFSPAINSENASLSVIWASFG